MATACVTGATGYVASELIKQLLVRGYAVKATVRCAVDSPRLQYLRDIADKGAGSLQLVQVPDIEHASEALERALQGVSYVFHVASPFRFDGELSSGSCSCSSSAQHSCSSNAVIVWFQNRILTHHTPVGLAGTHSLQCSRWLAGHDCCWAAYQCCFGLIPCSLHAGCVSR